MEHLGQPCWVSICEQYLFLPVGLIKGAESTCFLYCTLSFLSVLQGSCPPSTLASAWQDVSAPAPVYACVVCVPLSVFHQGCSGDSYIQPARLGSTHIRILYLFSSLSTSAL